MNTHKRTIRCPLCGRDDGTRVVFPKFFNHDYGHAYCRRCAISFDDNAARVARQKIDKATISRIRSNAEFRKLFVETSRIHDGESIYTDFNWESQDDLKKGITRHIVEGIKKAKPTVTAQSQLTILDLGAGNGFTSRCLKHTFPAAQITAVDPSPSIYELNGCDGILPVQGTVQSVDFESKTFDVVVIIGNVMLHPDPFDTVRRCGTLLRTGGCIVFDFKNIRSLSRSLALFGSRFAGRKLVAHPVFQRNFANMRYGLTKKAVQTFVEKEGFCVDAIISKPPRLLEFSNRSVWSRGVKGVVWKLLDMVDSWRGEQAWIQYTISRPV